MPTQSEMICDAIQNRRIIIIGYGPAERMAEPRLLGMNDDFGLILNAWQLAGGIGTGWRQYRLPYIHMIKVTRENFSGPRPSNFPFHFPMQSIICRL